MFIEVIRFNHSNNETQGILLIDGKFECYILEDEYRNEKVFGKTRIPEGTYNIGLRKTGGFHSRYLRKFPKIHDGMLCIYNEDDWKIKNKGLEFQYVLIHIGNNDEDTAGCLLVGLNSNSGENNFIAKSKLAYEKIYPRIAAEILLNPLNVKIKIRSI